MSEKPRLSELLKRSLLRSFLIILTILGALFVFGVVYNLREGTAAGWQVVVAASVVAGLVILNRWWYRRSGTRI